MPRIGLHLICGSIFVLQFSADSVLRAQGSDVASTVHNLSVSGPGEIRAASETRICRFCHVPHSAVVPTPLWGHSLSKATYLIPEVSGQSARASNHQPNGSSRLCLSCHDGTVALGDISGVSGAIQMHSDVDRLSPGRPGFIGTDLSGSHPVSFVLPELPEQAATGRRDMGVRPRATIVQDPDVKLDELNRMQCTSCHDPHSDRNYVPGEVPRFWVKQSVQEVCLTCHELE